MKDTMDAMVDEFNATVGAEEGIVLSVTSISGSADLHKKLTMAANGDPGAPALPDISTVYPKTALILAEKDLLLELDPFFTEEELSAYIPQFLEEGRLTDKKLYVFPFAKSTEVLFVNKTIFNRFSEETGISLESLATFEGILKAAEKYYKWTDEQTPESLAAAIERFEKLKFDNEKVKQSADKFSEESFKRQLGDLVEKYA